MKAVRTLFVVLMIAVMAAAMGCSSKQAKTEQPAVSNDDAARRAEEEAMRQRQLEEQRRREAAAMAAAQQEIGRMIHFDFDKYDLKPEARSILQAKAQVLKQYANLKIVIEGYCDERGTEEYNLALGERRAKSAYEFLVLMGIQGNRMTTVSYGKSRPLDPAHNEVAWAKNRRCEFKVAN
ncbi:peptidoglycan-associated lipoprotein [Desulfovibrio sp. X2]|uniref:peptidoglycan-associated lipoprotein Pal n=1 Tax=Desulfovibrio sp. X2 TaxID=941449 RepID=UPI0003586D98|nr:peptidoglycan-associated lipoprotein Pal [Desulfovibrio sp. X2]EPR37045.1 peptidoglycan-associated lipoprotein [Desulfovibrio sp. X2]